jgi:hypothetical protein
VSVERAARFVEDAYRLTELGWALIRLDGKIPKTTDWPKTEPLGDPNQAAGMWAEWGKRWNMGVVLGTSRLCVVEYDTPEAEPILLELLGGEWPETPTVFTGSGRRHLYFEVPPNGVSKAARDGLELRLGAHQCVVPPSEHPETGRAYFWELALEPWSTPLLKVPADVLAYFEGAADELRERLHDPDAKVYPGQRREQVFKLACSLIARGVPPDAILTAARAFNETRCEPPLEDEQVEFQVDGAVDRYDPATALPEQVRPRPDALRTHPASPPEDGVESASASVRPVRSRDAVTDGRTSTSSAAVPEHLLIAEEAKAFGDVEEASAESLLGDTRNSVLVAGGAVQYYGDGGAGKTTTGLDRAFHYCAGSDWLGLRVARPLRVLWIENEGPRGKFREKVRAKFEAWDGPPLEGRLHVLSSPWARFTFASDAMRADLVQLVRRLEIEVVIAGPVSRLGAEGGGTPKEIQAFVDLLELVRADLGRPLAYELIHHENKAGNVSGAWEGATDTLAHVQSRGNGHTAIVWRKTRWAPDLHGKTWKLDWLPGERFALDETPETTDDELRDRLVELVRENPGGSWNTYEKPAGGNATRARRIRDELIEEGRLVNVGKGKAFELYLPEQVDTLPVDEEPAA